MHIADNQLIGEGQQHTDGAMVGGTDIKVDSEPLIREGMNEKFNRREILFDDEKTRQIFTIDERFSGGLNDSHVTSPFALNNKNWLKKVKRGFGHAGRAQNPQTGTSSRASPRYVLLFSTVDLLETLVHRITLYGHSATHPSAAGG